MFLSIGDILQLSRLAADLYTKGWVVAREAPQEFRDLVHELLLLKDVLFIVHRKITRDDDGLYGDPTKRVLQQCFGALSDFSVLVAKYEKLGELPSVWKKSFSSCYSTTRKITECTLIYSFERPWSLVPSSTVVQRAGQHPCLSEQTPEISATLAAGPHARGKVSWAD